jgi:hypothetical protein
MACLQSHLDEIANGHVLKNTFWTCFVAPSGWHMFLSGRCIHVTVLNELKLFPRSRDDDAIINTGITSI